MDREKAIERIKAIKAVYALTPTANEALDLAIEALGQPMVVYCRNCKHSTDTGDYQDTYFCDNPHHDSNHLVHSLEYCSHGKPKEKHQLSGETSTNDGVAESATTTDEVVDFNNMISDCNRIRNLPPVNQKQITVKLESAENATSEGEESTISQPKSKFDCISRQQAIEAFCDDCRGLKPGQCEHWDKCKSQKVLRSLPPVTPTERTGEWKIWNEPENKCVYCTKCKHEYDQIDLYIGGSEYPNHCPNCGAKMGGDTE